MGSGDAFAGPWIIVGAHVNPGLDPQESDDLRERARRIRYIAEGLSQAADRERIHQYADELEKRAAELEQEAARPTGPTAA